jgi:DNA modification methylase
VTTAAETAVRIDVARLLPAEWNANRVPAKTLAKIQRSIERFGFVENLVARPHPSTAGAYEVLSGNHRLKLATGMGFAELPVIVVALDDAEARLLAQTLNRTRGADDPKAYAELLEVVLSGRGRGDALEVLPETDSSLDRALAALKPRDLSDVDDAPEPPAKPKSKRGTVYELGPHRLMCGDATSADDVAKLLGGDQVQLVLTDPPYGVDYADKVAHLHRAGAAGGRKAARPIANDELTGTALEKFLTLAFVNAAAHAIAGAPIYVWHADGQATAFRAAMVNAGWAHKQNLVWVKERFVLGRQDYQWRHEPVLYGWKPGAAHRWYGDRREDTVIDEDAPLQNLSKAELIKTIRALQTRENTSVLRGPGPSSAAEHPTMKPVWALEHLIHNSTIRGDHVLDLFAGAGSTLMAAAQTGRRAFAMELDPGYCDVIRRRYETFTGGTAL